jgi:hypothetical protein
MLLTTRDAFMPMSGAVDAAREQLAYWRAECAHAHASGDIPRIVRCERFIAQCELMISTLSAAQKLLDSDKPQPR